MRVVPSFSLLFLTAGIAACGGEDASPPTHPAPAPAPFTVTIGANGLTPPELTVPQGARVLFINSAGRRIDLRSNPHPEHSDCVEVNNVGVLNPGGSKETGNLNAAGTCAFHDDDAPGNAALQGRILVR